MKDERRTKIAEYIRIHGDVSMKELKSEFKVSMNTIRTDISSLVESKVISKVYGGVRYINPDFFSSSSADKRINTLSEAKRKIAALAASLIENGDTIYIDYGTTTMHIIEALGDKSNLTVVTPNFYVMTMLAGMSRSGTRLIVLPGEYEPVMHGVFSENTIKELKNYKFSKAFMACTGVDGELKATTTSYYQRKIKQTAMKQAQKSFLLVDSTKFNSPGLLNYCDLHDFSLVFTDSNLASAILNEIKLKEISLATSD